MDALPTGTVTFLFTDIEGSTRMVQALRDRWRGVLEDHDDLLRSTIEGAGGLDLRTEGDAHFAVFRNAPTAVAAAAAGQRALAAHAWPADGEVRVRMGIHTGEGTVGGDDYVGLDVHRTARIAAAAHGGQVLLSSTTAELAGLALPDGVELRDLGKHRLKDLARAERIFQATVEGLPSEFPPIRSLETPTNLPVPRTSFVGRRHEVERAKELLRGPGLLTFTGPAGSGKTRLALRVAHDLLDAYTDGVFFVELESSSDPRILPSSIADAVGARAEGRRPVADTLREHLRDREVFLVLDNFEQMLPGAPLVADLLDAAPRVRVLVTSREPLHLAGEQEFPVPPLGLPDSAEPLTVDRLERSDSIALFVQRATAVDPDFRITDANAPAVAELCRRVDGLPLAIELAASRVKLLSPQGILERLEHRLDLLTGGPVDLPARQRTLREAIGWSHDLLDETERVLFRRLAVFAGGWTLETAPTVVESGTGAGRNMIDVLGSLVDKSLVTRRTDEAGAVRFGMLATIREFALERLEETGEGEQVRRRQAGVFLDLAERAEPHLRTNDQKRWLDELELEHDNMRAALQWAIDAPDANVGVRMVGALWRFWHFRGHLAEGRRWAEEATSMPAAAGRTAERAHALTALGGLAYWQEDVPAFARAYEEALAISREIGDRPAVAEGLYNLSYAMFYQAQIEEGLAMLEQARAIFDELGDRRGIADTVWFHAVAARLAGDLPRARTLAAESLALHRETGDRFGMTDSLFAVGRVAFDEGDLGTMAASFFEALDNEEEVGNRTGMGIVLDHLAAKASAQGDHLRALRLGGASEAMKQAAGGHAPPPLIDLPDPRETARSVLGDAAVAAAWKEGRAMPLERALAYARETR
jgi:predicted ATPase/class 3 adenylate cyclase